MILVTGATGEYGKLVIQSLLEKGVDPTSISALVRNTEKAKNLSDKGIILKTGNYDDLESLIQAFKGVEKLLFVSGSEIESREQQHKNIVEAAKKTQVKHIIYTSFIRNTPVEESAINFLQDTHLKTENWIKESGLRYTILQHALYMDMLPMFIGEKAIENGSILQPAKLGKSSSVLRADLAEAAAIVLTSNGHENKTYALSNPEAHTYEDLAQIISRTTGQTINYVSPTPEEYNSIMKSAGVPQEYIGLFTAFSVAQANGELELNDPTLEKLLNRKPTSPETYLGQVYS
jgi:NAD(P)H dehydrogenase (quinone)